MTLPRLLSIAAMCLLAGCASAPADEPLRNTTVTLLPGASASLNRSVTLRYDAVTDSRCPLGATCIWAGEVRYQLTLSSARGAETFALHAANPASESLKLPGVRVAIEQAVIPPQVRGDPQPPHPVTFSITRTPPPGTP